MSSNKLSKLSMRDVAENLLREHDGPINIYELLEEVSKIKNISADDIDKLNQLYLDITQSAKFVFVGDDQWDIKERNLEYWDKDGYSFVQHNAEDDIEEDDEELDFSEFILPDEEEELVELDDEDDFDTVDEDEEEEKAYIEVELPLKSTDDDDDLDEDEIEIFDEDDYGEIMDDYEDMYDDE